MDINFKLLIITTLISSGISVVLSILANKYFYERPQLLSTWKWWHIANYGTEVTIFIKNFGKSPAKKVHICSSFDNKIIRHRKIDVIEPGGEEKWLISELIGQGDSGQAKYEDFSVYKTLTVKTIFGNSRFDRLWNHSTTEFDINKEINKPN